MATPIDLDATSSHVEFQIDNCDGTRQPLGLHVIAKEPGSKEGHAVRDPDARRRALRR